MTWWFSHSFSCYSVVLVESTENLSTCRLFDGDTSFSMKKPKTRRCLMNTSRLYDWKRRGIYLQRHCEGYERLQQVLPCHGKGGFWTVYISELLSALVVAVNTSNNRWDCSKIPVANIGSFKNEIRMLTEARHRNVVKLYGFCWKWRYVWLKFARWDAVEEFGWRYQT